MQVIQYLYTLLFTAELVPETQFLLVSMNFCPELHTRKERRPDDGAIKHQMLGISGELCHRHFLVKKVREHLLRVGRAFKFKSLSPHELKQFE